MRIETERLELVPLTAGELRLWVGDPRALDEAVDASQCGKLLEGRFTQIVKGQLPVVEQDPVKYLWQSFWLLVRKADRVAVGSADFKTVPNGNGEVEIGYGLHEPYEHNGYMTETVGALCAWALAQDAVTAVTAETERQGYASQRLLK